MTMTLGDLIREYRTEHDMSMSAFAEKAGVSKAYISLLEKNKNTKTGKSIAPSLDVIKSVAKVIGKDFNDVLDIIDGNTVVRVTQTNAPVYVNRSASTEMLKKQLDEILEKIADEYIASLDKLPEDAFPYKPEPTRKIPLLGSVSCGEAMFADDNIEGYIDTALSDAPESDEFFWMKAKGNSMINAGISEGDALLIRQQSDVDSGDIAVVVVGDNEATLKRVKKQDGAIILQAENPAYEPRIFFGDNAKDVRIIGRLMQLRKKF